MTGKQQAVLWMGLLLILVRLFTTGQWDAIWGTVTAHGSGGGTDPSTEAACKKHCSSVQGPANAICMSGCRKSPPTTNSSASKTPGTISI